MSYKVKSRGPAGGYGAALCSYEKKVLPLAAWLCASSRM